MLRVCRQYAVQVHNTAARVKMFECNLGPKTWYFEVIEKYSIS